MQCFCGDVNRSMLSTVFPQSCFNVNSSSILIPLNASELSIIFEKICTFLFFYSFTFHSANLTINECHTKFHCIEI